MPLWRQHSYDSILFFFLWIENTLITLINYLRHHGLYNKRKAYTAMAVVYEISVTFAWWNNHVLVEKKKKKITIKRTYHHPVDSNTSSSNRQPHPLSRNRCTSLSLSRNSKDTFTQPESESVSLEEESSASPHSSSFSDDWRVRYVSVNWLTKFKVPSSSSSRFRKQFSGKKSDWPCW